MASARVVMPLPRSCPDSASMCKHVAAVLYGIGARLDKQPELLFRLREVDEGQLMAQAGKGLQLSKRGPKVAKVLRGGDAALSEFVRHRAGRRFGEEGAGQRRSCGAGTRPRWASCCARRRASAAWPCALKCSVSMKKRWLSSGALS